MLYSEAVKLILESLGRKDEVEYYLKRFRSEDDNFFSIIVPDYDTLNFFWEAFLLPMEILSKLELFPIIFIGGPNSLQYIEKFKVYNFFELITNYDKIIHKNESIKNKIPVIFTNEMFIKFYYNYNQFLPKRIHFVRNNGNIKNKDNQNLFKIEPYLDFEQNWMIKSTLLKTYNYLSDDIGIYLYCSHLFYLFKNIHISITSSFFLLKELFTIKGAGTLIRKKVNIIHLKKNQIDDKLKTYLKEKIELYFNKKLKLNALEEITDIIFDESYESFIILEQKPFAYYLSKFAVSIDARGKGIAQDLWDYVESLNYPLFWKTRKNNSIKKWYEKISDGLIRYENYIIFWKNLSYKEIPKIMDFIINRGSDFYEEEF
jgi:acetylglutamate kinase